MNSCPDLESVVDLEQVLDWKGRAMVRHMAECRHCLERLEATEEARTHLGASLALEPELEDRIAAAAGFGAEAPAGPRTEWLSLPTVGTFLAATTTLLLLLGGTAATLQGAMPGPEVGLVAALGGLAAAWSSPSVT